jgi:hypothetical protein
MQRTEIQWNRPRFYIGTLRDCTIEKFHVLSYFSPLFFYDSRIVNHGGLPLRDMDFLMDYLQSLK